MTKECPLSEICRECGGGTCLSLKLQKRHACLFAMQCNILPQKMEMVFEMCIDSTATFWENMVFRKCPTSQLLDICHLFLYPLIHVILNYLKKRNETYSIFKHALLQKCPVPWKTSTQVWIIFKRLVNCILNNFPFVENWWKIATRYIQVRSISGHSKMWENFAETANIKYLRIFFYLISRLSQNCSFTSQ